MENLLKEFHVLDTKIGPVGFHGPSAKLFELPLDIATTFSALETGNRLLGDLSAFEHDHLTQTLRSALPTDFGSRTNMLGDSTRLTNFYLFVSQDAILPAPIATAMAANIAKAK